MSSIRRLFGKVVLFAGLLAAPVSADWVAEDGHTMHDPQLPDEVHCPVFTCILSIRPEENPRHIFGSIPDRLLPPKTRCLFVPQVRADISQYSTLAQPCAFGDSIPPPKIGRQLHSQNQQPGTTLPLRVPGKAGSQEGFESQAQSLP